MSESEPLKLLTRPEHNISRENLPRNVLKVLYRLRRAGFEAYLVGGSVRDLLRGQRPKDYDVSTNARPERVRRLFRNSRLIGRRFRLVHVLFPDGTIEVSTFRANPNPEHQRRRPGELLVTNDNTYGTPRQDAFRRDFTINALFYRISDFAVVDYVGGLDDLRDGKVRVIGDADVRFREDPVRMLRGCEFAGRFGFDMETETQASIERTRHEIAKAAPARLIDELLGLLRSRHAKESLRWMHDLGLLEPFLPEVDELFERPELAPFARIPEELDTIARSGDSLSDGVLLGALLLPQLIARRSQLEGEYGTAPRQELQAIIEDLMSRFAERFSLSNARSQQMFRALDSFQRLCEPDVSPKSRRRVVLRPSFGDGLQLFQLVVDATGEGRELLGEWRMLRSLRQKGRRRPTRRGPRSR